MTELIPVTNRPVFNNPSLEKYTVALMKLDYQIRQHQFDIAYLLGEIQTQGLYKDDGFENCAEYAMVTFGMQKTKAYELIDIGQQYTRPIRDTRGKVKGHCSNLLPIPHPELMDAPVIDFTPNQIARLRTLGRDKIISLIESGEITPSMTSRKLDEVVKLNKAKKVGEPKEEPATNEVKQEEPTTPDTAPSSETPNGLNQEESTTPCPIQKTRSQASVNFDLVPTDELIAELFERGYKVYDRLGDYQPLMWAIKKEEEQLTPDEE